MDSIGKHSKENKKSKHCKKKLIEVIMDSDEMRGGSNKEDNIKYGGAASNKMNQSFRGWGFTFM